MSETRKRRPKNAIHGALVAPVIRVPGDGANALNAERTTGESAPGEQLTRAVQGQPATDLEERVARAAEKHPNVRSYQFNPRLVGGRMLPPNLTLSYAIYAPVLYPVQVDPQYPNNTGDQRMLAQLNDALLTEHLKSIGAGAQPVRRFSRLELSTQRGADLALKGMA